MKSKRWIIVVVMTLAVGFGVLAVTVRFRVGNLGLRDAIATQAGKGAGTLVDVGALARFEWDEMHVVGPRATDDELRRFGVPDSLVSTIRMSGRDDVCLLVFTQEGRYRGHVVEPRAMADFAAAARTRAYLRAEATFLVNGTRENSALLIPQVPDPSAP